MLLIPTQSLFSLGEIVITSNALSQLTPEEINSALRCHASGNWGTVCPNDGAMNNEALTTGDRLFSAYGSGERKFWIITEWNRSVTTILLPEDY